MIVGVIGGIASGKSLVTRELELLGAEVVVADDIAHQILRRTDTQSQLAEWFGPDILMKDGIGEAPREVDRARLSRLVFGDSEEHRTRLKKLESLVQPQISKELLNRIDGWKLGNRKSLLVLDIPLLLERDWDRQCDEVWFVDTPNAMRKEFAKQRGWSEQQLASRESAQLSLNEKRKRSHRVIENNSDCESLRNQVRIAYRDANSNRI